MRLISIFSIFFFIPVFSFSNDSNVEDKFLGSIWKITKFNGKTLPEDAIDLEFKLIEKKQVSLNIFKELYAGKDDLYSSRISKSKWFVENNKLIILASEEAKPKNIDKAPQGYRNIVMKTVCRVEILLGENDSKETKNLLGNFFFYSQTEGNINGSVLDNKTDLGPTFLKLIFDGNLNNFSNFTRSKIIKPIDIIIQKTN